MKEYYNVLVQALLTERTSQSVDKFNQYTFEVARDANKIEIAKAVEEAFDLKNKVLKVRTMNVKGHMRRLGRYKGYKPDWKKAIVTLVKGAKIDTFEG
ncbi:MAG: 50S ribosomal protein L23 [Deltaproteobacteria bacterium]|nr:50S ribosomal protein L23 [Deltaproteobacteria bacterium]